MRFLTSQPAQEPASVLYQRCTVDLMTGQMTMAEVPVVGRKNDHRRLLRREPPGCQYRFADREQCHDRNADLLFRLQSD